MSSILRSDFVFVSSDLELRILENIFPYKKENIFYLPFFYEKTFFDTSINESINDIKKIIKYPEFKKRKNYVFIGNYQHQPNKISVLYISKILFPAIIQKFNKEYCEIDEKLIPEFHIYGVNIDREIKELEKVHPKIKVKGFMQDISILKKYRVCLCPILFGAGIKGNITDSWYFGLPVITSFYGAESLLIKNFTCSENFINKDEFNLHRIFSEYYNFIISNKENFGGLITNNFEEMVQYSFILYTDEQKWREKTHNISTYFIDSIENNSLSFESNFRKIDKRFRNFQNKNQTLIDDVYKNIFTRENYSSQRLLSKYIQLKNKLNKTISNELERDNKN